MVAEFLFFLLATVAVVGALGMVLSRNPVSSALWLILNLFCVAGLYISLNAAFIGVIQVLVYAGAIMVLFLFVIMLLNLAALPNPQAFDWKRGLAFVLGLVLLAQLVYVVAAGLDVVPETLAPEEAAYTGAAETLAVELFTRYALSLEVVAILLLAATIGAVMLAKRRFE